MYEGENPALGVKMLEEPKRRLRYLESEEEHRLLDAAPEPLRTIILAGIHCGLRLQSEALTLRWSDVDLSRRTLTVQAEYAKSGQTRTVPLNSAIHAALSHLKIQTTSEFVFTTRTGKPYDSIRTGFESACIRASLEGVTPHTTRHSFATKLIANAGLTCEPCKSWVDGRACGCWSAMDTSFQLERRRPSSNSSKNFTTGFTTVKKRAERQSR